MSENKEQIKINRLLSEEDAKKYAGMYVCTVSFKDHTVVAAHLDAVVAKEEATAKGHPDAACFFVPRPFDRFAFIETSEAITFR